MKMEYERTARLKRPDQCVGDDSKIRWAGVKKSKFHDRPDQPVRWTEVVTFPAIVPKLSQEKDSLVMQRREAHQECP